MYGTVGRSTHCADPARATLCSRHGRSNSLSPGRARYAASQLCSTARLRRPLMISPADRQPAQPVETSAAAPCTSTEEYRPLTSAQRHDVEQSSSTVDDDLGDVSGEVCEVMSTEPSNNDSRIVIVPPSDSNEHETNLSETVPDDDDGVTNCQDLPTRAEHCTVDDDRLIEEKREPEEQKVEEQDITSMIKEEPPEIKDHHNDVTNHDVTNNDVINHVIDGDMLIGEVSLKDEDTELTCKSPEIKFNQVDTMSGKFDSSALEKILNSLSATTSRRDNDETTTTDDTRDDDIWMRRDVQSSLSVLDGEVAKLDNSLQFKPRRRRSTSSSSSSSSSVGHCSPSCLIPHSTQDTDNDNTLSNLLSLCVNQVTDTTTDCTEMKANTDVLQTSLNGEHLDINISSRTDGQFTLLQ